MYTHNAHGENDAHVAEEEEFRMDYSKWSNNNLIAAVIFFGFVICAVSLFVF